MPSPNAATRRTILANLFVHGRLDKRTLLGSNRDIDLDFLPGDDYISEDTFDGARDWLVEFGLVDWRINERRRGRPGELHMGPAWGHVAGVVVGHQSIRCGIGNGRGELVTDRTGDALIDSQYSGAIDVKPASELMQDVVQLVTTVLARGDLDPSRFRGITLALPAPVDRSGRLINDRVLRGFAPGDHARRLLAAELEGIGLTGASVHIDNDANVTGLGEWHLRYRDEGGETLIAVKVSGGVGAALVNEDGALVRGAHGVAGEIGHTPVDVSTMAPTQGLADLDPAAICPRCGSGAGHLESYVSATAVLQRAFPDEDPQELATNHKLLTSALEDPAHPAHERVLAAVADAGSILGRALAPIAEFTDPGIIVIAGRMRSAAPFEKAIALAIEFPGRAVPTPPRVVASTHGWSGVMGAIRNTLEQTPPSLPPVLEDPVRRLYEDMRSGPPAWQIAASLLGQTATRPDHVVVP